MQNSRKSGLLSLIVIVVSIGAASFSVVYTYQAFAANDTSTSQHMYIDWSGGEFGGSDGIPDCEPRRSGKIACHAFNDRDKDGRCDLGEFMPEGLPPNLKIPLYTGTCDL